MLRGRPQSNDGHATPTDLETSSRETGYPTGESAFGLEDKPLGIRFYRARESCFYPYALLQGMRLISHQLKLSFATADVVITGEGMHELYVRISWQTVGLVVEQHPRNQPTSDGSVFVTKIEELVR